MNGSVTIRTWPKTPVATSALRVPVGENGEVGRATEVDEVAVAAWSTARRIVSVRVAGVAEVMDAGTTDEGTTDEGTTDEGTTDEGAIEVGRTDTACMKTTKMVTAPTVAYMAVQTEAGTITAVSWNASAASRITSMLD